MQQSIVESLDQFLSLPEIIPIQFRFDVHVFLGESIVGAGEGIVVDGGSIEQMDQLVICGVRG
jgi:hypothetical protein